MNSMDIIPMIEQSALDIIDQERRDFVGKAFDNAAKAHVFSDYISRRAKNTLRRQLADLTLFADYLADVQFVSDASGVGERLQTNASSWQGVTHGLVTGFVLWQLRKSYAVASVNVRLSTVKQYAKLALQAGVLSAEQHALIRTVAGYRMKEQIRLDEQRVEAGIATRKGAKKSAPVALTAAQVRALKTQPDTAQGRRDALLMCLLLDHGLRCGEVAALDVSAVDMESGTLTFYREKVGKIQTHKLSKNTLNAMKAWFEGGHVIEGGKLLRSSAKSKDGSKLGTAGMSTRAITKRVEYLGKMIGVDGLSAHDGRHSWATRAARAKTNPFALQEAGGWNSLAMPRRYVEASKIANEDVKLDE